MGGKTMLTLWNPFTKRNGSELMPMTPDLDRIISEMDRSFSNFALPTLGWSSPTLVPAADVIETADAITMRMDLPGHQVKDIHVNVENDVLTVRAERKAETQEQDATSHRRERSYGLFTRSFVLPATVDAQRTEARYENGVLSITLPKREDAKPKAIDIKVRS
jgi:HSP20 family protein